MRRSSAAFCNFVNSKIELEDIRLHRSLIGINPQGVAVYYATSTVPEARWSVNVRIPGNRIGHLQAIDQRPLIERCAAVVRAKITK